jgi:hypothetical protein
MKPTTPTNPPGAPIGTISGPIEQDIYYDVKRQVDSRRVDRNKHNKDMAFNSYKWKKRVRSPMLAGVFVTIRDYMFWKYLRGRSLR